MTENKRFTYMEQFNGFCDVYDCGKILSCMRLEHVENTVNLLNELNDEDEKLKQENKELKLQNEVLLYQIGEIGKNNKTCRECEYFIPKCNICYMWDMEVEADDVVVACDQREVKKYKWG